ncbi:MAG: PorT family protein [Tannerella sp.]|jgi:hypothetical protein|nr:PorT family protein [Tannerella sp.]
MKEEQDIWKEVIRSKLIDFEVDVEPDNWEKIEARLAEGKVIAFRPFRRFLHRAIYGSSPTVRNVDGEKYGSSPTVVNVDGEKYGISPTVVNADGEKYGISPTVVNADGEKYGSSPTVVNVDGRWGMFTSGRYVYMAAAAIAALVIGTLFFLLPDDNSKDRKAKVETKTTKPETPETPVTVETPSANEDELKDAQAVVTDQVSSKSSESVSPTAAGKSLRQGSETPALSRRIDNKYNRKIEVKNAIAVSVPSPKPAIEDILASINKLDEILKDKPAISLMEDIRLVAESKAAAVAVAKPRRWGIGMGGGGYGVNSSSLGALNYGNLPLADGNVLGNNNEVFPVNSYHNSSSIRSRTTEIEMPSGVADHKMPISIGLGFGYYLSERWTLQSGLVYTLLRSKWGDSAIDASITKDWKQNLHFIGIPVSASYKIGDWKRMRFYASAGGMCELNIAGVLVRTDRQPANPNFNLTERDNIRINQPLWSFNGRLGVSYPLWRFLNAYAEAGASYYPDYTSNIKTIRSDKPFSVSMQAGLRFGF